MNDATLIGIKRYVYVLIKILKFCTGSSVKSFQCKFAIASVLCTRSSDINVVAGEVGRIIQEVIRFHTIRGKFSSVHPELRREGIVRVEVGEGGLHFVRDTGERGCLCPFRSLSFQRSLATTYM